MASQYIEDLNDEQRAVVMEKGGPLLVLAGAGSGKTRTLTYRVAWLLESGVSPERILVATFTNKAARSMLSRVSGLVGADVNLFWGGTFHHIGHKIVRRHADLLGYDRSFSIIDSEDARQMVNTCLSEVVEKKPSKFPKGDILRDMFSFCVNTEKTLYDVISDRYPHFLYCCDVIQVIADRYAERKKKLNVMDFDDLLVQWRRLLIENPDIRRQYAERFLHVLVDEYQDTNRLQGDITDLLAEGHRNIMVVGDDSQSIYSFRGANYANIANFPERYPGCRIFRLEINYRSTPEILHMANLSIQNNPNQFPKTLRAVRERGARPALVATRNVLQQADFVSQRIIELMHEGVSGRDMAVLYRAHYHSMEVQMELTRRGIPFELRSGIRFFEQAHIKDVASYMRIIVNPRDELAWKRCLGHYDKIGRVTADKIWREIAAMENPLLGFLSDEFIKKSGKSARPGLEQCRKLMQDLLSLAVELQPDKAIDFILKNGYHDYLLETYTDAQGRVDDLVQLANFSSRFPSMEAFLNEMTLLTGVTEEGDDERAGREDNVVLSTIHQAKGLEWKVVFLIWCADGMIPLARALNDPDGEEEERRLFYVATTRAKDQLYLSYPTVEYSRGAGYSPVSPSRFLKELVSFGRNEADAPYERWLVDD
jgi:DNA helicase II / ATP-dependent DNA helicase PcrA